MSAPRREVLAALLWLAGCSSSDSLLVDAGLADAVDAAVPADAVIAGDTTMPGDAYAAADGAARDAVADAAAARPDGAALADAGVGGERCEPSAALLARVSPQRLHDALDGLVAPGERTSPAGQARAAAYLRGQLEAAGLTVREQSYLYGVNSFVNLEVTITGSVHPDVFVMAGGHYDATTGSPGADDNASGATALLETARVFAGCRPDRSIRILFFSNEEAGSAGSQAYVAELKTRVAPSQVIGFMAVDMVGYPPANGELAFVTTPASKPLADVALAAVDRWTTLPTALSVGEGCG